MLRGRRSDSLTFSRALTVYRLRFGTLVAALLGVLGLQWSPHSGLGLRLIGPLLHDPKVWFEDG